MNRQIELLLVEDNPDHAEMSRTALEEDDPDYSIHVQWVKDGQEVIDYLKKTGAYADSPRPDLILLDINLPKLDGIELLRMIKEDDDLRIIPVIMLTTSDRAEEILKCYTLGANSFITKPVKFKEFTEKIRSFKRYWLKTNRGPQ